MRITILLRQRNELTMRDLESIRCNPAELGALTSHVFSSGTLGHAARSRLEPKHHSFIHAAILILRPLFCAGPSQAVKHFRVALPSLTHMHAPTLHIRACCILAHVSTDPRTMSMCTSKSLEQGLCAVCVCVILWQMPRKLDIEAMWSQCAEHIQVARTMPPGAIPSRQPPAARGGTAVTIAHSSTKDMDPLRP